MISKYCNELTLFFGMNKLHFSDCTILHFIDFNFGHVLGDRQGKK